MKSFFEQYGFVILAAIVVIILIAMCTPIGSVVKTQIESITNSFASKTENKLDTTYNERSLEAGTVISIEGENYIVLQQKGETRYLVWKQDPLSVDDDPNLEKLKGFSEERYPQGCKNNTCIFFDSESNKIYNGSDIDNYLENIYYPSLSSNLRSAVIKQNITQEFYDNAKKNEERTTGKGGTEWQIGTRHVFLPSAGEVLSAVKNIKEDNSLTSLFPIAGYEGSAQIPVSFFKDSSGDVKSYYLRDGLSYNKTHVFAISQAYYGVFYAWASSLAISARPAFVVDLSLINYEIVEKLDSTVLKVSEDA